METATPCVHHWIAPATGGGESITGTCRDCGATRQFATEMQRRPSESGVSAKHVERYIRVEPRRQDVGAVAPPNLPVRPAPVPAPAPSVVAPPPAEMIRQAEAPKAAAAPVSIQPPPVRTGAPIDDVRVCPECRQSLEVIGAINATLYDPLASGVAPLYGGAAIKARTRDRCPTCNGDREWRASSPKERAS